MTLGNSNSPPLSEWLTIQEAADLLNVSRSYFIKHILNQAGIRFHRCGKQRKVHLEDMAVYLKDQKIRTEEIMAKLAALSQEMGLLE